MSTPPTLPLFVDRQDAVLVTSELESARVAVRRAKRYTTKAESAAGQDAHRALHEAEVAIARALATLR